MNISPDGKINWTPNESQGPGIYNIDICASDETAYDCENITINVNEENTMPSIGMIENVTVDQYKQLVYTISAIDNDIPAQSLYFSLVGEPMGATINPEGILSWTPEAFGDFTFDICVSDGSLSDCQSITVTVNRNKC